MRRRSLTDEHIHPDIPGRWSQCTRLLLRPLPGRDDDARPDGGKTLKHYTTPKNDNQIAWFLLGLNRTAFLKHSSKYDRVFYDLTTDWYYCRYSFSDP